MHHRTGQDVLRDVTSRLAPAELAKLDETCRAYAARPYPPQRLHRPATDPLGAGIETVVLLPILVSVVAQVLADLATRSIRAHGPGLAGRWRRRRSRHAAAEERREALTGSVPELAGVTREELMDWALAQGRAAGLSHAQAETCAHVIVVAVVPPAEARADGPAPQSPDGPDDARTPQTPQIPQTPETPETPQTPTSPPAS
ncbi:hypothetical protein [Streptomyces adustus]|uniref:hypothetical protein n=1 Tax=Streptomyces adustus TaxID=1609272 RepID=UPI003721B158